VSTASAELGAAPAASRPWWRGGAAIVGARGGDALLRLVLFLATARVLSESDFSRYALLTAALGTAQTLLALGAPRTASYFDGSAPPRLLAGWLLSVSVAASAVPLVLLAALPALRLLLFPSITPGLLGLALAPLPFLMLADSLSSLLLARRRERTYGAMLWGRSAGAALVLATSLFASGGGRLVWLLAGRIGVSVLAVAGLAASLGVRARFRGIGSFGRTAVRFAAPVAASGALVSLHRRADVFLLSTLGRASEIGAYAVAYTFAEAFWIVTDSLEAALFVDLARVEPREALARTRRAALLFGAIAAVGVVGLFGGILLIRAGYGGAYARAQALFPWVLAGALLWGASRPFSSFLYSRRRGGTVLALHAAGLLLNVALCLRWIPSQGALGAAHATLASYSLVAAALVGATAWAGGSGRGRSRSDGREGREASS